MVIGVSGISIREYQPSDETAALQLLTAALGHSDVSQKTPDYWRWKHVNNHFGQSHTYLATSEEGDLAGLRAFMRWTFQLDDVTLTAVRAVDTSTHPDHQRKGIFKRLTLHALAEVERDGRDLVFNTPNEKSMPGYLKMGWDYVGKIHPIIRVMKPISFAAGYAMHRVGRRRAQPHATKAFFKRPALGVPDLLQRSDELEDLLASVRQLYGGEGRLITPRTLDYLRWRYAEHPQIPYYAATVERDGRLQAVAIYRTNTRFGLKEAVMCELFLAGPDDGLCKELLKEMKSALNADYVICYFAEGSPVRRLLDENRFWTVPRLGMDFTVKPISQRIPVDARKLSSWSLSMGDLELF